MTTVGLNQEVLTLPSWATRYFQRCNKISSLCKGPTFQGWLKNLIWKIGKMLLMWWENKIGEWHFLISSHLKWTDSLSLTFISMKSPVLHFCLSTSEGISSSTPARLDSTHYNPVSKVISFIQILLRFCIPCSFFLILIKPVVCN